MPNLLPFKVFPCRLPQGNHMFLATCRKEAKSSFPLLLNGPYRLEGETLATRLAVSRNRKHSCSLISSDCL